MRILHRPRSWLKFVSELQYVSLMIPALVVFTIGMVVPIVMGFSFSLTNWSGLSRTMAFIGLNNYKHAVLDKWLYDAFKFTILFVIFNTSIQNIFALLFAMALDKDLKGQNIYRTIIFMPALLSPILCGFLWSKMFAVVLPTLNEILGTQIQFGLLARHETVLAGLLIINNWKWIGYWMMIYLAALQAVPAELYESLSLDGGSEWHRIRHVTLPLIRPALTICIVGIAIGSFKVYDLIVTATGGGPGHASVSIVMYIYNMAFLTNRPAYASAISILYMLFLMMISIIQLRFLRRREVQL